MIKYTEKIDTKVSEETFKEILNIMETEQRSKSGAIRLLIHEALISRETLKKMGKRAILIVLLLSTVSMLRAQSIPFDVAYPTYKDYALPLPGVYSKTKIINGSDTTFRDATGKIVLTNANITIDNAVYAFSALGEVTADTHNEFWQNITFTNGFTGVIHRGCYYALIDITIQPSLTTATCYYFYNK